VTRLLAARRTLAAFAVLPLLLTALAACGDKSHDAADATASDTAPVAAAHTYADGDSVDPSDFADRLADGFARITTAHATVEADLGATGDMHGDGDVDYTGDQPATAMTLSSDALGDDIDTRLVDGVLYLNLGRLSHDKFWKVDLDDPDSPFGTMGSQLDPKSSVDLLEKAMKTVTYVGEDGDLDHYQASIDPKSLVEQLAPSGTAGAPSLPKSMDYDIWLDNDDRVNKLSFAMGDLGSFEMTLSDFGAKVSVEAPPADQVTEMPEAFTGHAQA
jgi:hypothetical protein